MTMRNADLPAYPADQQGAHGIALEAAKACGHPCGTPAYERAYIEAATKAAAGLTKREAFAMAAMQGVLANEGLVASLGILSGGGRAAADNSARFALAIGDAMLRALEA